MDQSWKANYKTWRLRDTVSLEEWAEDIPAPRKSISLAAWEEMAQNEKRDHFQDCITSEAVTLSKRVRQYRSPDLGEVQQVTTRAALFPRFPSRYHVYILC